jgi:hypothetical protein
MSMDEPGLDQSNFSRLRERLASLSSSGPKVPKKCYSCHHNQRQHEYFSEQRPLRQRDCHCLPDIAASER